MTKISTRHHKHNKSRDASKKIKSFTQIKVLFTNYRDLLTFKMQIDKLDFNLLKCELCRNVTLFMWKMPYVLDYMNNSVFGNIISNTPAHKTTNWVYYV